MLNLLMMEQFGGTNPNVSNTIVYNYLLIICLILLKIMKIKILKKKNKKEVRFDIYIKDNEGIEHFMR